uniref:Uncharacterized protein n=1 Tax=Chromera velia CCMP2878 TaxID=1169474 RepID=A0A0G4HP45_9ALVE|eukprot:Cvel_29838.t1-p1 / transcript=Cvel_29838.t1 / gene=Cvel_29838 / organism=Chromera_velia_CCMP2878 / gene_product=hypothetical protein / transcript_product=hypothetical protein / location=Cvel_scaffold4158:8634-10201(+) / protein_length=450 / sequence_SO=supercontig / SO=protein_coding / is_pseudo=false
MRLGQLFCVVLLVGKTGAQHSVDQMMRKFRSSNTYAAAEQTGEKVKETQTYQTAESVAVKTVDYADDFVEDPVGTTKQTYTAAKDKTSEAVETAAALPFIVLDLLVPTSEEESDNSSSDLTAAPPEQQQVPSSFDVQDPVPAGGETQAASEGEAETGIESEGATDLSVLPSDPGTNFTSRSNASVTAESSNSTAAFEETQEELGKGAVALGEESTLSEIVVLEEEEQEMIELYTEAPGTVSQEEVGGPAEGFLVEEEAEEEEESFIGNGGKGKGRTWAMTRGNGKKEGLHKQLERGGFDFGEVETQNVEAVGSDPPGGTNAFAQDFGVDSGESDVLEESGWSGSEESEPSGDEGKDPLPLRGIEQQSKEAEGHIQAQAMETEAQWQAETSKPSVKKQVKKAVKTQHQKKKAKADDEASDGESEGSDSESGDQKKGKGKKKTRAKKRRKGR